MLQLLNGFIEKNGGFSWDAIATKVLLSLLHQRLASDLLSKKESGILFSNMDIVNGPTIHLF